LRGLDDVQEALVRSNLELLARLLVHVRAAKDRVPTDFRRKGDWTRNMRARSLRRFHDVTRGFVEKLVIERFEADPDFRRVGHDAGFS
jgi:hypothetical protein